MTIQIIKGTEVKIWLDDDIIGRASSVTVKLENNVEEYFEIGDRDAIEIVEKLRSVSGSLERAVINGMLFAKAYTKTTLAGGVYSITAGQYQNPETTITAESIVADNTESVFELDYQPPIQGTVIIKRDAVTWGTEGVDWVVDYEDGIITFAIPPTTAYTWTVDYHYGRSYTITFVMQVGDGTEQRTDVTVGGVMFDSIEMTVNNSGDIVQETLDYKAKNISGISLGLPTTGI